MCALAVRKSCLLILPDIVSEGLRLACRELVDFLVVGVTKPAKRPRGHTHYVAKVGTARFHASPTVISSRRETVLYRHLPALAPTMSSAGDPALVGITTSINNISSAMHSDLAVRETRYAENKKSTMVHEKYGDRTACMLNLLTRSEDDNDLPDY
jgi:hypothetical protein